MAKTKKTALPSKATKKPTSDLTSTELVTAHNTIKELRECLCSANAELATRRQQAKNMMQTISGQLSTPLSSFLTRLDSLLLGKQDKTLSVNLLNDLAAEGRVLLQLAETFDSLADISDGPRTYESGLCSLPNILEQVEAYAQQRLYGTPIEFNVLPIRKIPHKITTDSIRLRQILCNVIECAAHCTNSGSIVLQVSFDSSLHQVHFEISDSSSGFEPEVLYKIDQHLLLPMDEVLSQALAPGVLQLKLAYHQLQNLNGEMKIKSFSQIGTTVSCLLKVAPVEYEQQESSPSSTVSSSAVTTSTSLKSMQGKILLIDDSFQNHRMLSFILRKTKIRFSIAEHYESVMAALHQGDCDLILIDLNMPNLDGLALAQQIRSSGFRQPIFAITGLINQERRNQCTKSGIDVIVEKPLDVEQFYRLLAHHLAQTTKSQSGRPAVTPSEGYQKQYIAPQERTTSPISLATNTHLPTDEIPELQEILHEFLNSLDCNLQTLRHHAEHHSWRDLGFKANELAGAAAMCGLHRISDMLLELEVKSGAGDFSKVAPLIQNIEQECKQVHEQHGTQPISTTPETDKKISISPSNPAVTSEPILSTGTPAKKENLVLEETPSIPKNNSDSGRVVTTSLPAEAQDLMPIVHEFLDSLNASLNKIQELCKQAQWLALDHLSHDIAGTAALCGFQDFSSHARKLRQASSAQSQADAQACVETLLDEGAAMLRGKNITP